MSERDTIDALIACLPLSDDGTGHIVDCGYDDEEGDCACYTLPYRLASVLAAVLRDEATVEAVERALYCAANETSTSSGLYTDEARALAHTALATLAERLGVPHVDR